MWCTAPRCCGRASAAVTHMSSVNPGSTVKYLYGTSPSAGISKSVPMSITMSGLPICQPVTNSGIFGSSLGLPSGAPPSTQATIVSICSFVRLRSLANLPCAGSASHGGIVRATTFSLIAFAQGRTSL